MNRLTHSPGCEKAPTIWAVAAFNSIIHNLNIHDKAVTREFFKTSFIAAFNSIKQVLKTSLVTVLS